MNIYMQQLKYALIGCGVVARKHLKAARYYQRDRQLIEIVAVVDTRPGAPLAMLQKAGFKPGEIERIRIYTDYQEMLGKEKPDLVAITTPSGSHAVISLAALEAGAHVLVEKPLTLSLAEADQILDLAAERQRTVAVGHIYRFFPMVAAVQRDLAAGRFGRILYGDVKVRWGHDQAYYDQAAWRGTWNQDGGALMNQSIHALDLMTWLLGSSVQAVSGQIWRQNHQMEAEDLGLAILNLANGSQCLVEGTTNTDPRRPEASFFIRATAGDVRGGIVAGRPALAVYDAAGQNLFMEYFWQMIRQTWRQGGIKAFLQLKNPHSGLLGDWIAAVNKKAVPLASGQSGRQAVELVLAIYQSAKTATQVRLPVQDFSLQDMRGYFD